jgi:hypothetical protein
VNWICWLKLQFKINIREWHLLNGFRVIRYSPTVVFYTHFYLDGWVHKQYVSFWASGRRCIMHQESQWVPIWSLGILGPVFFEETVNSERHLTCCTIICASPFFATDLSLQTQWFMHDRARAHSVNVISTLCTTLDTHVISKWFPDPFTCAQSWPSNTHDLNPLRLLSVGIPCGK